MTTQSNAGRRDKRKITTMLKKFLVKGYAETQFVWLAQLTH